MKPLLKRLADNEPRTMASTKNNSHRPGLRVEELETRALMSTLSIIPVGGKFPVAFSDGNFATPALAAKTYQYDSTGTPWTYDGMAGVSSNGSGFTAGNPNAPGGGQVAFLQQSGSMSQSFSLPAGSYSLSFDAAQRANVQAHFQAFNVLVDGAFVDVVVPVNTQYNLYQTPKFTVAAGVHTIQFKGLNPLGGDNTVFVTAVQINSATSNPPNDPVLALALTDYARDGSITYNDMLGLFAAVENFGGVDTPLLQDLQAIVADASAFQMPDYVGNLASKVVDGDPANAHYQGAALGDLHLGSSASQLQKLVNKWFLGMDRPGVDVDTQSNLPYSYLPTSGTLFGNGVSYTDVRQGGVGDCWLMASLEEVARVNPAIISSMFIDNGNNTYTVRFYQGSATQYVTVDKYLPVDLSAPWTGNLVYAHSLDPFDSYGNNVGDKYNDPSNKLWVPLAEKAYAQLNESGWMGRGASNSYGGLDGGYAVYPLSQISGAPTSTHMMNADWQGNRPPLPADVGTNFNAGRLVVFETRTSPGISNVVGRHDYALLGYDAATNIYTIGNPWGTTHVWVKDHQGVYPSSSDPSPPPGGILNLTVDQLQSCIEDYAYTTQSVNQVSISMPVGPLGGTPSKSAAAPSAFSDVAKSESVPSPSREGKTSLVALDLAFRQFADSQNAETASSFLDPQGEVTFVNNLRLADAQAEPLTRTLPIAETERPLANRSFAPTAKHDRHASTVRYGLEGPDLVIPSAIKDGAAT